MAAKSATARQARLVKPAGALGQLEALSIQLTLKKLVEGRGYSPRILQLAAKVIF